MATSAIAVLANGVTVKDVVVEGCLVAVFDGGPAFQVGDLGAGIPATLNSLKAPYNAISSPQSGLWLPTSTQRGRPMASMAASGTPAARPPT